MSFWGSMASINNSLDEIKHYRKVQASIKNRVKNQEDVERILKYEKKGRFFWKIAIAIWIVPTILAIIAGGIYLFKDLEIGVIIMVGAIMYMVLFIPLLLIIYTILAMTYLQPYVQYDKFYRRTNSEEIPQIEWIGKGKIRINNMPVLTMAEIVKKVIITVVCLLIACLLYSGEISEIIEEYQDYKIQREKNAEFQESVENIDETMDKLDESLKKLDEIEIDVSDYFED